MTRSPTSATTAIGIDVGGTNVRAARVGRDGRLTDHVSVRTGSCPDVVGLVRELCAERTDDTVAAIGIGIPGRLDRDGTTILSAGFVDLAGVRLGPIIEQSVGRPTTVDNDAHMALTAELALGAASAADHVVMFTAGTGIGGAVAMDRVVLRGRGNAGQLGHLTLDPDGAPCRCGRRGCSEVLASGTALARLVADAGLPADTTVETLLASRAADPAAAEVLCRWASTWRDAIDTVVAVVDPELVVLGGGLGAAAIAALEACAPTTSAWFECPVVPARLGDEAGVIGAGLRALAR
jgi:glucokinase